MKKFLLVLLSLVILSSLSTAAFADSEPSVPTLQNVEGYDYISFTISPDHYYYVNFNNDYVGSNVTSGPVVEACQGYIVCAAYMEVTDIDGFYGPFTQRKIKEMQQFLGLSQDGICGPLTWRGMYNRFDGKTQLMSFLDLYHNGSLY